MKRIQEKVKDIVEVRAYESLKDFTSDPALTVSSYHFTDATSELMSVWVDRLAAVQTGQKAFALAGYRGVGKSHFLATLGALVSQPELRSRITDPRVAASAERLSRRHYPIAYVRRGTHETLLDEFKAAIGSLLGTDPESLTDSPRQMLETASQKFGDMPLVLMIDTAFERGMRVTRDDGPFLSEVAEASRDLNLFLGVALDDDIAGADGLNSAIARSFAIDYLDQEHLYKVVNSHVFPKAPQMQGVLQGVYNYFREVLPHFRWSEQRFSALYPLHPIILEVAPFVRLYVHDFALLSFASLAAERIMGRPANSLIALDEVFDSAEKGLRQIEDLGEAFEAYDRLNAEVVAKIPVMQRLQAKLILKALLLLSLDGEGTTAGEISAAMLIFDEAEPDRAVEIVRDLVQKFADALPEHIRITANSGAEPRYGFKVASKDNLNRALAEAIAGYPLDIVDRIVRKQFVDRFTDCAFSSESDGAGVNTSECITVWRGSMRRGLISWDHSNAPGNEGLPSGCDWLVSICSDEREPDGSTPPNNGALIRWKPDNITNEENETILRYYALSTDPVLRESFSDQIRAALHSHSIAVEKIISRIFLEDGKLVIDGFDYNFTEDARAADSLSGLFTVMLEPLFETRYPAHPYFQQILGPAEVSSLVAELFAPSRQQTAEYRSLANAFAVPLGIARVHEGFFVLESEESVAGLPVASSVLSLIDNANGNPVSFENIYAELNKEPFGLVKEAQYLILTALAGHRRLEFITSKGDRISRRSLDLKIIWDDIVAVAKPAISSYSAKNLVDWAQRITGNTAIASLDNPTDLDHLAAGLELWLREWQQKRILETFNTIPDHLLNTGIWRLASQTSKTLGALAEHVASALAGNITLDECLIRAAETFMNSADEFDRARSNLAVLDAFIKGIKIRAEINSYVSCAEITESPAIETLREQLYRLTDSSYYNPSENSNRELTNVWEQFQNQFSNYYAEKHDATMRSQAVREKFEGILRSDHWWVFENLSSIKGFDRSYWHEAVSARRTYVGMNCGAETRDALLSRPKCKCDFDLMNHSELLELPERLNDVVERGLVRYSQDLENLAPAISKKIREILPEINGEKASVAEALIDELNRGLDLSILSAPSISLLSDVMDVDVPAREGNYTGSTVTENVYSDAALIPAAS